ncbi:ATP-binding protein [Sphingobium sp. EM0848]|uniref:ATP-binding protein n=1 Tax=Sphingobium sp. EM0848 TaxID=2743473 RepID=UPI00159C112A|nr:ATP-binding protein [Sphingobium sp. EM0848]
MRVPVRRSLLAQVVFLYGATAIATAIVLPFAVSAMLRKTASRYEHGILSAQTNSLASTLAARGASDCNIPTPASPSPMQEGLAYIVTDRTGRVLSRHGPARPGLERAAPRETVPRFFRVGPLEGLSTPLDQGRCAWIIMSQDRDAPQFVSDDIVRSFLAQFALLFIPLLFLVPAIGALLTGRMIHRLKRIADIATSIGPRTADIRLPLDSLPAEVVPLASATNRALDRLADGLRAQSEFAANVAHELRTPLALIRLKVQTLEETEDRGQLLNAVDRAGRVVTQLLALVELERSDEAAPSLFRPKPVVETMLVDRAPHILSTGRTIELLEGGDDALRVGQPEMLALALDNLLDNALHHTPPGTNISVTVHPDGSISVEDDGPGIAPEFMGRITQRFWRADRQSGSGVGIGLSIVNRIASSNGGRLEVSIPSSGRGIRFMLTHRANGEGQN